MNSDVWKAFNKAVDEFFEEHEKDLEEIRAALAAKFLIPVIDVVTDRLKESNNEVLQHEEN